jgi:D-glycero-D-manno-heptose 1,7-bisphosphate phosphatase
MIETNEVVVIRNVPGPALFLDRDGVINVDHGYVHRIDQFDFLPGIFDLVRFAVHELDWPVIVITNQAGIGRGLFGEKAFQDLTAWMCERFASERAPLTRIYHCPYHPEFGIDEYRKEHPWRKPNPGMVLAARADLDLDLARSVLIGDKPTDIQCAMAAGIGLSMFLDPDGQVDPQGQAPPPAATVPVRDLSDALALLRSRFAASAGL